MNPVINFINTIPTALLLLLSAASVTVGDYFAKLWSVNHRPGYFLFAVLLGVISSLSFFPTLLREGLVVNAMLWTLLSLMGWLFVGLVIFHERLSPPQFIGIVFGVVSVVLISMSYGKAQ